VCLLLRHLPQIFHRQDILVPEFQYLLAERCLDLLDNMRPHPRLILQETLDLLEHSFQLGLQRPHLPQLLEQLRMCWDFH
jgi:hypothetical protein